MDAKDLRTEAGLGDRCNDGNTKYVQGGAALACHRPKTYQDLGSNTLGKVDVATSRPCAVIGPDRVVPPPASTDAYLKKGVLEPWLTPDNTYRRPPDYPHKLLLPPDYQHPTRNISPRQTFQENMQRIMVPPSYNSLKLKEDHNFKETNISQMRSNKLSVPDSNPKFCEVPYSINPMTNELKNVRNADIAVSNVNTVHSRSVPHGWPASASNGPPKPYPQDLYQYPDYPSCAGPKPVLLRPHRTVHEEPGPVYSDAYYHDSNIRFKPYPTIKERYPQARYDYIGNYTNPFHPPPFPTHKYDMQKPSHPYPGYPQVPLKYLDGRMPDPTLNGYQRQLNQQPAYNNIPFRTQMIHPTYGPIPGNCLQPNKFYPYPVDSSKSVTTSKLPYDANGKIYAEFENNRNKSYPMPEGYYVNDIARPHALKGPVLPPNYPTNMHTMPGHPYYRKDNQPMKGYEYNPHFRNMDPTLPINNNHLSRFPSQFSPNTIAISPSDSNTSNDTNQTQGTSQEDCGYVSQSSTASIRSMESNFNRMQPDVYRRYDHRYGPPVKPSSSMLKLGRNPQGATNAKYKKEIDVRQFLTMWNEGEDENGENANKEVMVKNVVHSNNNTKHFENSNQEQLYVLGLVNVPSEELGKYEHIQKVSKLPENIKGYNSIELLHQFEEVIESSNLSNYHIKPQPPRDFRFPLKGIIPMHGIAIPPRPLSPLDVEAKISQSVIHKEVGCNFEIKPCSPKMLNVEVATLVQSVLDERTIEKVSNPLMIQSPSILGAAENGDNCNVIKCQDRISINESSKIPSCKMINTQYSNSDLLDPVKTNYSFQDLESNSGVCLASLPRLDNDIELNFPEVNQQFINANKESVITSVSVKDLSPLEIQNSDKNDDDIEKNIKDSTKVKVEKDFSKLSKYRKLKKRNERVNTPEANVQALRTDSVIIKNPDNCKTLDINMGKSFSPKQQFDNSQVDPINLSVNTEHHHNMNEETITDKSENQCNDLAIDFSLNSIEQCNNSSISDRLKSKLNKTKGLDPHCYMRKAVFDEDVCDLLQVTNVTKFRDGELELKTEDRFIKETELSNNDKHIDALVDKGDYKFSTEIVDASKTNNNNSFHDRANILNFKKLSKRDSVDEGDLSKNSLSSFRFLKENYKSNAMMDHFPTSTDKVDHINHEERLIEEKIEKISAVADISNNEMSRNSENSNNDIINFDQPNNLVESGNKDKSKEGSEKIGTFKNPVLLQPKVSPCIVLKDAAVEISDINTTTTISDTETAVEEGSVDTKNSVDSVDSKNSERCTPLERNDIHTDVERSNIDAALEKSDIAVEGTEIDTALERCATDTVVERSEIDTVVENGDIGTPIKNSDVDTAMKRNDVDTAEEISEIDTALKICDIDTAAGKCYKDIDVERSVLDTELERVVIDTDVEKSDKDTPMTNSGVDTAKEKHDKPITVETSDIDTPMKNSDADIAMERSAVETAVERNDIETALKKCDIDTAAEKGYKNIDMKISVIDTDVEEGDKDTPMKNSDEDTVLEINCIDTAEERSDIDTSMKISDIDTAMEINDIDTGVEKSDTNTDVDRSGTDTDEERSDKDTDLEESEIDTRMIRSGVDNDMVRNYIDTDVERSEIDTDIERSDKNKSEFILSSMDPKSEKIVKYTCPVKKGLLSPYIQKLIMHNEGSCATITKASCVIDDTYNKTSDPIWGSNMCKAKRKSEDRLVFSSCQETILDDRELHWQDSSFERMQDETCEDLSIGKYLTSDLDTLLSANENSDDETISHFEIEKASQNDDKPNIDNPLSTTELIRPLNSSVRETHSQVPHLDEMKVACLISPITNINLQLTSHKGSDSVGSPCSTVSLLDVLSSNLSKISSNKVIENEIHLKDSTTLKKYECTKPPQTDLGRVIEETDSANRKYVFNATSSHHNAVTDNHEILSSNYESVSHRLQPNEIVQDKIYKSIFESTPNETANPIDLQNIHNVSESVNEDYGEEYKEKKSVEFKQHSPEDNICDGDNYTDIAGIGDIDEGKNADCYIRSVSGLEMDVCDLKSQSSSPILPETEIGIIDNLRFISENDDLTDVNYEENATIETKQVSEHNVSQQNIEYPIKEIRYLSNYISNKKHKTLKRSLSDSALDEIRDSSKENSDSILWPSKRQKNSEILEDNESQFYADNYCKFIQNTRRNSISSIQNEENVSFCILIDNSCIITDECDESQKICFTEMSEDSLHENNFNVEDESATDMSSIQEVENFEISDSNDNFSYNEKPSEVPWVDDVACVETVIADDIAENIVISAATSPKTTDLSETECTDDETEVYKVNEHTDKLKYIYGDKMCRDDTHFVETLYRTPQMNVNKTLIKRESQITDDCSRYYDKESLERVLSESYFPEVPVCNLTDVAITTPPYVSSPVNFEQSPTNEENLQLDSPSIIKTTFDFKENDLNIPSDSEKCEQEKDLNTKLIRKELVEDSISSCESSIESIFGYKKTQEGPKCSISSSPEVSSTTSEDKNSGILLKITNYGGARVSQVNDINQGNRICCKYTEKKDYLSSNNNLTPRTLLTKAAQKYIPPLKETIPDLKVKLPLSQDSLLKFKLLKVAKEKLKQTLSKSTNVLKKDIPKKPRPKFEDVLKSIDEIQFQMHKEKTKKVKKSIPKVVIKKSENGSHYASTSNKDKFNPDLTGRKWQPWVFLEKNHFIDKMALKRKTRAIFSHRKNMYVLAEKFQKYKAVGSTKFIISQPKLNNSMSGQLKYTIRLKHNY